MSAVVKLRNVNPMGQVDLPLIGRQGEPLGEEGVGCLEPGEVFEVTPEQAGRLPSYSKGEPDPDDPDAPVEDVFDPGEGLLAQVGNYELVKTRGKAAAGSATDDEKDGA